jgi:gliding motility-associated-like protein
MQDPGHPDAEQPNFTIEVMDQAGQLIDPVCAYYYVSAKQGLPTWHSTGDVIWKDWTTVGINLSDYVGQTVSIAFTTRDCQQMGHFGYAYISAYCSNLKIVYGYCPKDTIAYVTAPTGFSYKWGNGDTSQTTTVNHPVFGMIDSCVLTSVNGCQVKIYGSFTPTIIQADFASQPVCIGTPTPFTDLSTINQNQVVNWRWDFGDRKNAVFKIQNPTHVYDSVGIFNIKLISYSTDGCPDTITKTFEVVAIPDPTINTEYNCNIITRKDTLFFDKEAQLIVQKGNDMYAWSTGDSTFSTIISASGWYTVTIENSGLCRVSDSVMLLQCFVPLFMPDAFTPNDDNTNDFFRPVTEPERVYNFDMLIFDRWGKQIYEAYDVYHGWDGTIGGQPAPLGNYSYALSFMHPGGTVSTMKGLFTLVR